MLYTDAHIVTAADLARIESEIPDVATTETINVSDLIALTEGEFAQYLVNKMQSYSGYVPPYSLPYSSSVAITGMLTQASNRGRNTLSQVVVSDSEYPSIWSPLKTLLVYECVVNFYRQASSRRDKDRYEEKRDDYRKEIQNKYRPRFVKHGVGIVQHPFYCPGSLLEAGAGTWSAATNLSTLSGGPTDNTTPKYDIVVTWVDSSVYVSPANKQNGESGPSAIATISVLGGDQAIVSIANLVAPNGAARASALGNLLVAPMNTTGWNVYAGPHGGTLTRQNASVLPYATKTYQLAVTLLTSGEAVGVGQNANYTVPLPDIAMRG